MIAIEFPLRQWQSLFPPNVRKDSNPVLYDMPNGLTIELNQIAMPWEWASIDVLVEFDNEKDAAWFILSYGGKILPWQQ